MYRDQKMCVPNVVQIASNCWQADLIKIVMASRQHPNVEVPTPVLPGIEIMLPHHMTHHSIFTAHPRDPLPLDSQTVVGATVLRTAMADTMIVLSQAVLTRGKRAVYPQMMVAWMKANCHLSTGLLAFCDEYNRLRLPLMISAKVHCPSALQQARPARDIAFACTKH